jgi:hypothetical protein
VAVHAHADARVAARHDGLMILYDLTSNTLLISTLVPCASGAVLSVSRSPPGRSSQQNRPFEKKLLGAKFGQRFPMPSTGMRRYLDRARLPLHNTPRVPYNRLKMLPHLGPELPSPLESFSKGRFCCELLPGAWRTGRRRRRSARRSGPARWSRSSCTARLRRRRRRRGWRRWRHTARSWRPRGRVGRPDENTSKCALCALCCQVSHYSTRGGGGP